MLYALIVVYNKKCEDSITLNSLKKYLNKINIIIYDNSTKEFNNSIYCKKNNLEYYTQHKNDGLSKAYNFVINEKKFDNDDYMIILDDDTFLSEEYLDEVIYLTQKKQYDILLPVVISNNKIISPSVIEFGCRVKMIGNLDKINKNKITAINSGMVVKMNVYNYVKYNDNMFLDYIDHDFMKNIRNNNYEIKIMNSTINQNFSRFEKKDIDSELFRFRIYLKDFKIYCKNCSCLWFYCFSTFIYRLKNAIRYKSLKFFK